MITKSAKLLTRSLFRKVNKVSSPYVSLGTLIRQMRLDAGLTQRQLAARLHTSHSAISRLESGRHLPRLETLTALARVLRLPLVLHFGSKGHQTFQSRLP